VFGMCSVRILAVIPAILTDSFHVISQVLQENTRLLLHLGPERFRSYHPQFIINLSSYHSTQYSIFTAFFSQCASRCVSQIRIYLGKVSVNITNVLIHSISTQIEFLFSCATCFGPHRSIIRQYYDRTAKLIELLT
jgi:hypothetical protein